MQNVSEIIEQLLAHKAQIARAHATGEGVDEAMNQMFLFLSVVSDDGVMEKIRQHALFEELCAFFSSHWVNYFWQKEIKETGLILAGIKTYSIALSNEEYLMNYDPEVAQLIANHSPARKNLHFFMLGSGAFPETLIRTHFSSESFTHSTGIESCGDSVKLARELCARYVPDAPGKKIDFIQSRTQDHDYAEADVLLVANILKNKRQTVERVAATMKDDAVIIVRNPKRLGRLIHEDILEGGEIAGARVIEWIPIGTKSSIYALKKRIA